MRYIGTMKTVVHQSYRTENVPGWIGKCLESAQNWAAAKGFDYHFMGDEFFDLLPAEFRARTEGRLPIQSDLARLITARNLLAKGYQRTIWIDADVLIFDSDNFDIAVVEGFSFCREIWVQPDAKGTIKAFRNVHNALAVFVTGNSFLEFYIDACQRIITRFDTDKRLVNQIVGPKLLSSLHNTMGYPVIDSVGMLSPLVLRDIDSGGGPALDLLVNEMPTSIRAANLCSSLANGISDDVELSHSMMERIVTSLLASRGGTLSGVGRRNDP